MIAGCNVDLRDGRSTHMHGEADRNELHAALPPAQRGGFKALAAPPLCQNASSSSGEAAQRFPRALLAGVIHLVPAPCSPQQLPGCDRRARRSISQRSARRCAQQRTWQQHGGCGGGGSGGRVLPALAPAGGLGGGSDTADWLGVPPAGAGGLPAAAAALPRVRGGGLAALPLHLSAGCCPAGGGGNPPSCALAVCARRQPHGNSRSRGARRAAAGTTCAVPRAAPHVCPRPGDLRPPDAPAVRGVPRQRGGRSPRRRHPAVLLRLRAAHS
jgi:hypothetical protein